MSKHTKGPWQVHLDTIVVGNLRPDPEDPAYDIWDDIVDANSEADAHLIAAAPELLEKLNMALGYIENTSGVNEEFTDMLKKTIAKAEGK